MISSIPSQQFLDGQVDVPGNLPQQRRRNVAAFVERHRGPAPVGVAVLDVRAALPHGGHARA